MKTGPGAKTERIDIRITPEARRLLQQAARERHTTISQFVLESALHRPTPFLPNGHVLRLTPINGLLSWPLLTRRRGVTRVWNAF